MSHSPALLRTCAVAATLMSLGCGDGARTEAERRTFNVAMTATLPTGPNEHGWTVTPATP